jgi:hypothetical protein
MNAVELIARVELILPHSLLFTCLVLLQFHLIDHPSPLRRLSLLPSDFHSTKHKAPTIAVYRTRLIQSTKWKSPRKKPSQTRKCVTLLRKNVFNFIPLNLFRLGMLFPFWFLRCCGCARRRNCAFLHYHSFTRRVFKGDGRR